MIIILDYKLAPEKFGVTVRDSPKYTVIDEIDETAIPEGVVPSHAKLIANSDMLLGTLSKK